MSSGKNEFGGGNENSLYIPITDVEQESIDRLVQQQELVVEIVGWGFIENPNITFGDKRVSIHIDITFNAPDVPIPVFFFELILKTRGGLILFQEKQKTIYNGGPLPVGTGTNLTMIWDIAIARVDPKLVKMIVPHARGLTSLLTDKTTGELSLFGNMKLDTKRKQMAYELRENERKIKEMDEESLRKAVKKSKKKK